MAESLGSSVLDLSTDDSKLRSGLTGAEKTTRSRMKSIGKVVALGAAAGAAALGAAGAAAIGAAAKTAAYADQVDKASKRLGVNTQFLQESSFWASQNGISAQSMERAVGRLNQRIGRAIEGDEKYAEAFAALDVALKNSQGEIRATEDVMGETIQRLSEVEDPARQSALAAEVFGTKMARDLMPALTAGNLSLEEAAAKAQELGLVMSQDAVDAGVRFTDQWDQVKQSMTGLLHEAGTPVMTFFADTLFPMLTGTLLPALHQVADAFGEGGLAGGMAALGDMFGDIGPGLLESLGGILESVLGFVTENVPKIVEFLLAQREAFFDAVLTVFTALTEALPTIIPQVIEALLSMVVTLVETLVQAAPLLLAGAVQLLLGLVTALVDVLPTVLDGVIGLVTALVGALVENLPMLVEAGITLLLGLVEGLLVAIPQLLTAVIEMIPMLVTTLVGLLPLLIEGGVQLLLALVLGLVTAIPQLLVAIVEMIPMLIGALLGALPLIIEAGIEMVVALVAGLVEAVPQLVEAIVMDVIPALVLALLAAHGQLRAMGLEYLGKLLEGVQAAWPGVLDWFKKLPGRLLRAVGNLSRLLREKALQLIQGFIDGITGAFGRVRDTLGGLTDMLPSWKGPERVDRVLLAQPAEWIMEGFADSLTDEATALVRPAMGDVSAALAMDVRGRGGDGAAAGDVRIVSDGTAAGDFVVQVVEEALRTNPSFRDSVGGPPR